MNALLVRAGVTLLGQLLDHTPEIAAFVKDEWAALHGKLSSLPAAAATVTLAPASAPTPALPADGPVNIIQLPSDQPAVTALGPVTPAASQPASSSASPDAAVRAQLEADKLAKEMATGAAAAATTGPTPATPVPQADPFVTINTGKTRGNSIGALPQVK